ncbi:MAG: stage II sporulation protein R [Roseburia sp.]|nr:stage II sporulation protein R [Roseburia sp.]
MKQITKYIISGIFLLTVLTTGVWCGKQCYLQQQLAEKVLRFHVLANSDSVEDQQLKLEVRDAIGGYMQEYMKMTESKEDCQKMVTEQIPVIEEIVGEVVKEAGYSYEIHAELTECEFPVKTYGTYTFPAGNYDALRVTIGDGNGQNWWCVMYPNMCFENSMYEVVDEKAEESLRAVLDEEEYQAVLNSGDYEIRLWFLEWFR